MIVATIPPTIIIRPIVRQLNTDANGNKMIKIDVGRTHNRGSSIETPPRYTADEIRTDNPKKIDARPK